MLCPKSENRAWPAIITHRLEGTVNGLSMRGEETTVETTISFTFCFPQEVRKYSKPSITPLASSPKPIWMFMCSKKVSALGDVNL